MEKESNNSGLSNSSLKGANLPPKLRLNDDKNLDPASVADLIEWFLLYDEKTARMRHPATEELFQWKQKADENNGQVTYPFESAEARFAIGVYQAIVENDREPLMALWLNDLVAAISESRQIRQEISDANKLEKYPEKSWIEKSQQIETERERNLYLESCWLETICTAEARVLGWVYQEIYGRPFSPTASA